MVYVKKSETFKEINFLKSQQFISFTKQVDNTHAGVVNGVLPAGSVYPANDGTAEGITINDVDVSNGAQPAMREIKLYDASGKMIALPAAASGL